MAIFMEPGNEPLCLQAAISPRRTTGHAKRIKSMNVATCGQDVWASEQVTPWGGPYKATLQGSRDRINFRICAQLMLYPGKHFNQLLTGLVRTTDHPSSIDGCGPRWRQLDGSNQSIELRRRHGVGVVDRKGLSHRPQDIATFL
jgi:hypothetical protein